MGGANTYCKSKLKKNNIIIKIKFIIFCKQEDDCIRYTKSVI